MVKINWTFEAELWLKDIFKYISKDNKAAATSTINAIYNRVQELSLFSELGYRYRFVEDRHIRILLFGHYRIAYLIKSNGDIDILGIFHQALEIERYLF